MIKHIFFVLLKKGILSLLSKNPTQYLITDIVSICPKTMSHYTLLIILYLPVNIIFINCLNEGTTQTVIFYDFPYYQWAYSK